MLITDLNGDNAEIASLIEICGKAVTSIGIRAFYNFVSGLDSVVLARTLAGWYE